MIPPGSFSSPALYHWLADGAEFFCRVLRAIHIAQKSLRVEVYIFANDPVGCRVRDALVAAVVRGDGAGSPRLTGFGGDGEWVLGWFSEGRGQLRWFNPLNVRRLPIRNHREALCRG